MSGCEVLLTEADHEDIEGQAPTCSQAATFHVSSGCDRGHVSHENMCKSCLTEMLQGVLICTDCDVLDIESKVRVFNAWALLHASKSKPA